MYELLQEALGYLKVASRYKWWGVLVAWMVCIAGWVFVSQMPDQYRAEAKVFVDTRSILRPLLHGLTIEPDVSGQVRLMTRLLFTRPNLEKIARMTDLDLAAKDEKAMEAIVNRLESSLSINSARQTNIFTISADDDDPQLAKRLVQSMLTVFVEQALGEARRDSDNAQRFLDQQIKEYERRLQAAEARIESFKRENYGLLPKQGGDLYSQLQTAHAELEEAKLAVQEAINRRDQIASQLESEEPMFMEFGQALSPLETEIQSLQARMDEMLLKYTDRHPEVITLKRRIAQLKKQQAEQEERAMGEGSFMESVGAGGETNPVFQQMKITLSEAEANVASLQARVNSYENRIQKLKEQMDSRLKVETQLKDLNRDYGTIRKNYEALLARREQARLSESVEQNTDTIKFRVVDPPQVPSKPSAPNRILLSAGVLGGGFVIGVGLPVLLALLRPTLVSTQQLREIAGLPVLGSVSMNWVPAIRKRKWRELIRFSGACAGLLLFFAVLVLMEVKGINLYSINT
ncbi:XrtA system polysaccharide chain length determinant [Methylohalobius crimeensis]|uniref:XrtA system polysaccharide chain length determinant n=1 Tax=Methylohalobius crimeensis TaxID=244365 RepID=UPI0003B3FD24|nr:XrtA system polysaccharide chain length determinant [Methylohalobius crimeensis]